MDCDKTNYMYPGIEFIDIDIEIRGHVLYEMQTCPIYRGQVAKENAIKKHRQRKVKLSQG